MRLDRFRARAAILLALAIAPALHAAQPFQDPKLPLEQRVDKLKSLLTLDEKIGMLAQTRPAIRRLGIRAFTNFTEGLHGLGWVRGGSITRN
jgi:beta-glucosidase